MEKKISWEEVEELSKDITIKVKESKFQPCYLIGVTVGGLIPLGLIAEEFSRRETDHPGDSPKYNNFILYFYPGNLLGDSLRKKEFFKRFIDEHPDIDKLLCEKMKIAAESPLSLKLFDSDLYEAYKIMRSYGATDPELFG